MFEKTKVIDADVVFAGDSITQFGNWNEFFADDVINRGIGSDTAEGLFNRVDQIVELHPEKVFIMIGINDVGHDIPVEKTVDFVERTCNVVSESGSKVYLLSILPTCTADQKQTASIRETNSYYQEIADNQDMVTFVDLYPLYLNSDSTVNQALYSADGVHLNGDGYQIWIDQITGLIDQR